MNPNAARPIHSIEERLAYAEEANRWVRLYFDHVKFQGGEEGYYNRIVESEGRPGVAILPLCQSRIGLIHQYRYPIGKELWEIPRGFGETKDPREDAVRELREETGIEADIHSLIDLRTIHPNSGILASEVSLFAVKFDHEPTHSLEGSREALQFRWVPRDEVYTRTRIGYITDAFTLCALFRAHLMGII